MKRWIPSILLGLISLIVPQLARAQITTVSATIVDGAGQVLAGGTYKFSSTAVGQVPIGGSLDSGGSFSGVVIPHNPATQLVNDYWTVTICPDATVSCPTSFIQITGATLSLTSLLSPIPTISFSIPGPPAPVTSLRAYADNEVSSTPKGGSYFNVLLNAVRTCSAISGPSPLTTGPCTAWASSSGGGGSVGPGTANFISCFNSTTNVANCADAITDIGGVVNIPVNTVNIGAGGGAAGIGYPAGNVSSCLPPAAGFNNFCSVTDGVNYNFEVSGNGSPYASIGGGGSSSSSQVFNVLSYGAVGDGYHIAADTAGIKAAFAASAPTCGIVYFPGAHSYGFDTIAATYTLTNFCGTIQGDGYSSTITSNNDTNSMWTFVSPRNLTIQYLHFQQTPSGFLTGGFPVSIDAGTNILISHNYTNDGNTAWRIGNSTHVKYESNTASNQHGNGLFGPNNNDMHSVNNNCFNDGDGCEEYSRWNAEFSPTCHDITSTGMVSVNDGEGFIVDSCVDVSLSNFVIKAPGTSGMNLIQDHATTTTHYPDRVQVSNGSVYGAGYGTGINNTNAAPCIQIFTIDAVSEPMNMHLDNVHLEHCAGSGIYASDPNFALNLQTSNIWIFDAGAGGTSVGDPKNVAVNFIGGKSLKMTNTYVENAYGTSVQAISGNSATYVELNNTTSVNPNQRGTGSFINSIHNRNTSGVFSVNGAYIVDTWPSASRSGIVSASTTGVQSVSNVKFNCTVACAATNFSSTTTTSLLAPAASSVTNNDCAKLSLTTNVVTLADSGAPCGSGGGISGLTTGFVPKAASSTTIANSLCDEGITTANTLTCTDTAGLVIPKVATSGTNGGVDGLEGTGGGLTAATSHDLLWADSTAHRWKMNNNNAGALTAVGIATAGTANDCLKLAANGIDIVDTGSGCGSGGTGCNPTGAAGVIQASNGIGACQDTGETDNGTTLSTSRLVTLSGAGAASTSPFLLNGTTFTSGGSGTTTFPYFYMNFGTAPTTFSTSGVIFGINDPSGFLGNNLEIHNNGGGTVMSISGTGNVSTNGNISANPGSVTGAKYVTATNCINTASPAVCSAAAAGIVQVAAAATTLQVNTTAVTANSRINLTYSVVGITAPTNIALMVPPYISGITGGSNFTMTLPVAPATNFVNVTYTIID